MEKERLNLEQLWENQKIQKDNIVELYQSIEEFHKKKMKMKKKVLLIGVFTFLWFAINLYFLKDIHNGVLWIVFGTSVCAVALLLFVINYYRLNNLSTNEHLMQEASDYVALLLREKDNELQLSKIWLNVYLILFLIGIGLFVYPFLSLKSLIIQFSSYGILLCWGAICLYLNKKMNRNKIAEIEEMITRLKQIE